MNDDLRALFTYLERFSPEVSGHHAAEPEPTAVEKLERFARGEVNAEERAQLCELLRLHPAWLRWLADRVKLAREEIGTEPVRGEEGRPAS